MRYDKGEKKIIPNRVYRSYKLSYKRDEMERTLDDIFISDILLDIRKIESKLSDKIRADRGARYAVYLLDIIEDARILIKETLVNGIDSNI